MDTLCANVCKCPMRRGREKLLIITASLTHCCHVILKMSEEEVSSKYNKHFEGWISTVSLTNDMFKNVLKVCMITFMILNNNTFILLLIKANSLHLNSNNLPSFSSSSLFSSSPSFLAPSHLQSLPFAPLCLVLIRRQTSNLLKVIRNT